MAASLQLPADDTIWLGEYVQVLRRRKLSIVVFTILGVAAAVFYASRQTPIYESTARVLATSVILQSASTGTVPSVNMETEQSLVSSESVIRCAQLILDQKAFTRAPSLTELNLVEVCSAEALADVDLDRSLTRDLEVGAVPQSNVMTVSYLDPVPRSAQGSAQAFALAYTHIKTDQAVALLDQLRAPLLKTQEDLTKQIAGVNKDIADLLAKQQEDAQAELPPNPADQQQFLNLQSELTNLQQQLQNTTLQLQGLDPSKINPPQVILPAQEPIDPVSPQVMLIGLAGLLVGLVIGVAVAFVRERLDDSLRERADLETALGAPVLAIIPKVIGWRRKQEARLVARDQPSGAGAEAYRTLRTSVSFLAMQRGMKTIMVCSPTAGEGKTTTAANLAWVLADTGRRVVLVSADLRKPRLHRFFGASNDTGLSSILAGEAQPWECIPDLGIENLRVLPSGPVPARPAELLDSERMADLLAGLSEVADFVILDTAPVLLVADAVALAPLVDGILFVADGSQTSRSAVLHSRDRLEQVGGNVIGAVLNNFDPRKSRTYRYYGYGYYRSGGSGYHAPYAERAPVGIEGSENGQARMPRPSALPPERTGA